MIMPFLGVLLVLFLTYWGTKYISVRYARISSGRHMRVLERAALGQDKFLALVSINKKVYVLGVTGKTIATVCEFDENELPKEEPMPQTNFSAVFTESLQKYSLFQKFIKKEENGEGNE
jgi:flagellar biogenesis protein FliO